MKEFLIKILVIFTFVLLTISTSLIVNAEETINTKLDNLLNNIIELEESNTFLETHPVGSIYITTSSSESTTEKMEALYGGTWEAYAQSRTLMGYNSSDSSFNTVGATGGSATTTLTKKNLPSHTHTISHTHTTPKTTISSSGAHTHSTTAKTITSGFTLTAGSAGSHTHSFTYGGSIIVIDSTTNVAYDGFVTSTSSTGNFWPNINKTLSAVLDDSWYHEHSVTGSITIPALSVASSGAHTHTVSAMTTDSQSTTTSGKTGSGTAFNNLDPYITVYMYKRIS